MPTIAEFFGRSNVKSEGASKEKVQTLPCLDTKSWMSYSTVITDEPKVSIKAELPITWVVSKNPFSFTTTKLSILDGNLTLRASNFGANQTGNFEVGINSSSSGLMRLWNE